MAFESFIRIEQINVEIAVNNCSLLAKCMNNTMNTRSTSDWIQCKLKRHCTVDFNVGVAKSQEDYCLIWTRFANINCWFDIWEKFLVEFDGKVVLPDEQKSCILIWMKVPFVGWEHSAVWRTSDSFILWCIASRGWVDCCKNLQSATFITGSTAAGEVVPALFQFIGKVRRLWADPSWDDPIHDNVKESLVTMR